jgi:selenide,water dikinase
MTKLNRRAAELGASVGLHGATDITGYGLLGHADELARNSGVALRIVLGQVPLLPGAHEYAQQGIIPGGLGRNRDYLVGAGAVRIAPELEPAQAQLLFDPQTSGGLLFVLPEQDAATLRERFAVAGEPIWEIGSVVEGAGIDVR